MKIRTRFIFKKEIIFYHFNSTETIVNITLDVYCVYFLFEKKRTQESN